MRTEYEIRTLPFTGPMHNVKGQPLSGDGRTLEGYAAVFGVPTRIGALGGDFEEVIQPGAFARSISQSSPVLMFEHGKHPMVGTLPIGTIDLATEDDVGLWISARLLDTWLVDPVRVAIAERA